MDKEYIVAFETKIKVQAETRELAIKGARELAQMNKSAAIYSTTGYNAEGKAAKFISCRESKCGD